MKDDFKERDFIRRAVVAARELRAEKGFAGIEGPLASIQEQLLRDFKQSASIRHSGDKGTARETILREFLKGRNCLPQRYGVTEQTSFVVATSGILSLQMDIVIYDAMDAPRLFDLGGVQYFPVECVYGTIQVRSDLDSTKCIREALDNVASFKSLKYGSAAPPKGFGILFAYDASLKWKTVFDSVLGWETEHPPVEWPNMVVVLNQGILLNHDGRKVAFLNDDIAHLTTPQLMPVLGDDAALLPFYLLLMDMLGSIDLPRVPLRQYVSLPVRSGTHAVRFGHGAMAEVRNCEKHGDYLRGLREGAADEIIAACAGHNSTDAKKLMEEAYGHELTGGNWGNVVLFNPEALPVGEVLLVARVFRLRDKDPIPTQALGFEELFIDDIRYWIPHYYVVKRSLITGCPQCPEASDGSSTLSIDDWHALWNDRASKDAAGK